MPKLSYKDYLEGTHKIIRESQKEKKKYLVNILEYSIWFDKRS